ncbi:hypothetical protein ACFLSQ_05565 [Bacteroidota bacterium]
MNYIMIIRKTVVVIFCLITTASLFVACEDAPPTDYIQKTYVEAFLLVNEPIQGIKVLYTQAIGQPYSIENALVKNATVKITPKGEETILLSYSDEDPVGYYNEDNEYLVLEKTQYNLEIEMPDGTVITGITNTPPAISWIVEPKDIMHFPNDTLKQTAPDSIAISWTAVPDNPFYLVNVRCLDTMNYGIYLDPPVPEDINRRTPSIASGSEEYYRDMTSTNFIGDSKTGVVWMSFKWFGTQEISAYCPDYNYLIWFMHIWQMEMEGAYYDELYTSVEGAIGVFGSASVVRKETFVMKPQVLY